jgi:antitoxin component YwqK of YwqJK toxin-antitoxin module
MGESSVRLYNNQMKKLLAAMFVALLMTGWGEETHSSTPLTEEKAKSVAERLGLKDYKIILNAIDLREKTDDYTGWAKDVGDNGQIKVLVQFKDGKPDGLVTGWYDNRQKSVEGNSKEGNLVTAVAWKPNGVKCPVTNVVNCVWSCPARSDI